MIGKNNIEEKLFDYFEGDLSAGESRELESFVKDNPEYQVDFDAWKQSVIPAVAMQYEHADDLLVNEKSSPKGWLRWASGGALLCLVSVASVGLVSKYDDGQGKIADLKKSVSEEFVIKKSKGEKTNVITKANTLTNSKLESLSGLENIDKEKSGTSNLESLAQGITNKNDLLKVVPNIEKNSPISNGLTNASDKNINNKIDLGKAFVEETKQEELSELINNFNIAALKEGNYEFMLPFAMKKDKTPYENPNQPNLYITNNKDPYLNYSLAHTLEENASFAGNGGEGVRVEYLYRTEWPSVTTDNFTSQIISADGFLPKLNAGVGVIMNADRLGHGALNSTAISAIYSQKITLGGISFEPSVKGTYNQRTIAWGRVNSNDIKDPRNGVLYGSVPFVPEEQGKTSVNNIDLGLGMLVNAGKFYVGGQIDHLNQAEYSNENFNQTIKMPTKVSAMAGTDIYKKQGGKFSFSPSVNYVKFGNYNALWVNTQFAYQGFFLASGVATNEELMASLGYKNGLVRLAYGLGFSKPSEFSGLNSTDQYHESHQVSLRVNLHPKK